MARRRTGLAATLGATLLCGCADSGEDARVASRFDDVFVEARRVVLHEPGDLPLGGIAAFDVAPDGRWIVADAQEIRIHAADGAMLRRFGRAGGGPEEFGVIVDVAAAGGLIWVADVARDHLGGHDPAGGAARIVKMAGGTPTLIAATDDRLLVRTSSRAEPRFTLLNTDGSPLARFLTEDSALVAIPYWGSFLGYPAVPHAGGFTVASSLRYPLRRFGENGDSLGAFGSPPASWRPARVPEPGEFAGPRQLELVAAYVETFTTIDRLDALSDSVLLVTHGRWVPTDRSGPPVRAVQTGMDGYDGAGRKLFEDAALPGRVLHAARDSLYILLAEPPEGWIVGVFTRRQ